MTQMCGPPNPKGWAPTREYMDARKSDIERENAERDELRAKRKPVIVRATKRPWRK